MEKTTINNKDFFFFDSDDLVIDHLKQGQLYGEPNFKQLDKYILDKSGTVIDCGAHIGTFSFNAANNGRKMIAIEGAKRNAECLSKTFEGMPNVDVEHAILLNNVSKCDFSSDYGPFGSAKHSDEGESTSETLDNIVERLKPENISAIKFDLEGNEISAITGSLTTLKKHKPALLIEINGFALMEQNKKPFHLFSLLDELGYKYWLPYGLNLMCIDKYSKYPFCISDIICIHEDNIELYENLPILPAMSDRQIYEAYSNNYRNSNDVCKKYFNYIK